MNTNVFLAFPPGSGGNHFRNILLASSDFFYNTADNISWVYKSNKLTVHSQDTGSDLYSENLTDAKLKNALNFQDKNHLFYGHFGELLTFKNSIVQFTNKKFICISVKTGQCKTLLNQRKQTIGTPQLDCYHLGEQTFLYESFIYQKLFDASAEDIIDISVSEFFSKDLSVPVQLLENFLKISLDTTTVNRLHNTWLEKNSLLTL